MISFLWVVSVLKLYLAATWTSIHVPLTFRGWSDGVACKESLMWQLMPDTVTPLAYTLNELERFWKGERSHYAYNYINIAWQILSKIVCNIYFTNSLLFVKLGCSNQKIQMTRGSVHMQWCCLQRGRLSTSAAKSLTLNRYWFHGCCIDLANK